MAKRILIVDDDRMMRTFVSGILQNDGFEIVCAENGDDAAALLAEEHFDCVVTDFYMPGLDGFEIIEAMRDAGDNTPAVVMSGTMTKLHEAAVRMLDKGCKILKKPFSADELKNALEAVMPRKGTEAEGVSGVIEPDCTKRGAVLFDYNSAQGRR